MKIIKLNSIDFLLLVVIFFPWLSFSTNSLDTQPWILFLFPFYLLLLFLCNAKIRYNPDIVFFIVLIVSSVCISVIFTLFAGNFSVFTLLRAFGGYFIFAFVFLFFYNFASKNPFKVYSVLHFFNFLWLLFSVIQVVFGKYALSFFVVVRTSEERGVTSLAPEPTFFGLVLLFFNFIYLIGKNYNMSRNDKLFFFC